MDYNCQGKLLRSPKEAMFLCSGYSSDSHELRFAEKLQEDLGAAARGHPMTPMNSWKKAQGWAKRMGRGFRIFIG